MQLLSCFVYSISACYGPIPRYLFYASWPFNSIASGWLACSCPRCGGMVDLDIIQIFAIGLIIAPRRFSGPKNMSNPAALLSSVWTILLWIDSIWRLSSALGLRIHVNPRVPKLDRIYNYHVSTEKHGWTPSLGSKTSIIYCFYALRVYGAASWIQWSDWLGHRGSNTISGIEFKLWVNASQLIGIRTSKGEEKAWTHAAWTCKWSANIRPQKATAINRCTITT